MADLYTKNGKPLRVDGDDIFDRSGRHVGRRAGDRVYAPNGKYAGTIVDDVVVYRAVERASRGTHFVPRRGAGSPDARRVASTVPGAEPFRRGS